MPDLEDNQTAKQMFDLQAARLINGLEGNHLGRDTWKRHYADCTVYKHQSVVRIIIIRRIGTIFSNISQTKECVKRVVVWSKNTHCFLHLLGRPS